MRKDVRFAVVRIEMLLLTGELRAESSVQSDLILAFLAFLIVCT